MFDCNKNVYTRQPQKSTRHSVTVSSTDIHRNRRLVGIVDINIPNMMQSRREREARDTIPLRTAMQTEPASCLNWQIKVLKAKKTVLFWDLLLLSDYVCQEYQTVIAYPWTSIRGLYQAETMAGIYQALLKSYNKIRIIVVKSNSSILIGHLSKINLVINGLNILYYLAGHLLVPFWACLAK